MADPVGTAGAQKPAVSDLQLALDGSSNFATRLRELATAKDAAAEALKALALGKEVKAAYAEAKITVANTLSEAETLRLQAANEAVAGQRQSAEIVSAAEARAAQIIVDAQANAAKITAQAD